MTATGKETDKNRDLVFISYAEPDRQVADMIHTKLKSNGISCWIAHDTILPGAKWLKELMDAVENSKIVVLVFSANSEKSQWVIDEITIALNKNIKIIPFRIENVSPLDYSLRMMSYRFQWMDAYTPPMEKQIERLAAVVGRHLGKEPAKPIEKEKLKEQPETNKVKPVAKVIKEKIKKPADMPEDVKNVLAKANKVDKNKNGFWEAYYEEYDITMVYIPPGKFIMGSNENYARENPLHEIELDGYWMGKIPVTNAQYVMCLNDLGIDHKTGCQGNACIDTNEESKYSHIKGTKGKYHAEKGYANHPVIKVSWYGAVKYCEWLSNKTDLKFMLPTEAQWENAARGNDQRKYPWGNQGPNKDLANFDLNIGKTTLVGSYPAGVSSYGLQDMAGNVWEWCSDWYEADYYKNSSPNNPKGPKSGSDRVIRGGSWYGKAGHLRCANRSVNDPSAGGDDLGFRLCQDIK